MKEFTECIKMLDGLIKHADFAMFTGKTMDSDDYRILKAWMEKVEERLKALEADYIDRQGDGR